MQTKPTLRLDEQLIQRTPPIPVRMEHFFCLIVYNKDHYDLLVIHVTTPVNRGLIR
ncbi:MAG: hypothetical protein V1792_04235 [Pseudomonadota bacterium]